MHFSARLRGGLTATVRLDVHTARYSVLDRNAGDAELANDPGIGHEVPARVGHRELGGAGRDRERQQQLIGEVKLDGGCGSVMLTHRANHLVGDCFGRPSRPAIGGKARFQGRIIATRKMPAPGQAAVTRCA